SEMAARFADLPIALQNTVELAKCLNLELDLGKYFLPASPTPPGRSENEHLRDEAEAGLTRRLAEYGLAPSFEREAYAKRLDHELGVIASMGFAGYFLIVAEFIGWARSQEIPVGPGRGSGAGSLVAWALHITDLDPLRFDLLFERFLNPERVSMPDFDIDFCMDQRDRVIEHVADLYGHDKVSQIITYGTMAAKAVLRDTGRVLGMGYGFVDRIAKSVPLRPLDVTLEDALGLSDASRRQPERVSAELVARYRDEDDVRQLVDLARSLEGLTRNAGKHAGGVVIAPTALTDFAPLYAEAAGDPMVTQFDKDDTEAVGLVKFDFLGLRTLTIIDWTVRVINTARASSGEALLDMAKLPLDDRETFALLHRCETTAVFQLESRGMKELVRKLRPDCFDDIVALVALFRPGPLQSGMVEEFIARKHGRAEVSFSHPLLEPILAPTYGVIVYQEQVMQIAQAFAGYTLGGADLLRRAMGKKDAVKFAKERAGFVGGAIARGIEGALATSTFDLIEKFAEYGFNKSHSAAYAVLSYQTAWLKAHYPAEFMAAVLSSDMDHTDKVVVFLDDARQLGLTVLPPNVASSAYRFRASDARTIVYGLGAIKGVGEHACQEIEREREAGGAFRDLADFCGRVDPARLGKRAIEALLSAGALDGLAPNRASLGLQLPMATRAAEQALRDRVAGIVDMFGNCATKPVAVDWPVAPEWPLARRLTAERDVLGFYLSGHPMDTWRGVVENVTTNAIGRIGSHWQPPQEDRKRFDRGTLVRIAGQVAQLRRSGDRAFVQLADGSGRIEVSFFSEEYANAAPLLLKDALLLIEGNLHMDDFSGQLQIRGRHAEPLEDACARQTRALKLTLASTPTVAEAAQAAIQTPANSEERLTTHLATLLKPFIPGGTRVLIEYRNPQARAVLELGDRWRLRVTPALLAALDEDSSIASFELIGATAASPAAAAA
ncbi:MAG: DNA polymerase III subunit alpha, partial [Lysobacterales bacterium]